MSQKVHSFEGHVARTVRLDYLLFLPQGYGDDPAQEWPMILFLHGMGERGSDVQAVKKHGLPKILEDRDDLGFVVVSPQCPAETIWSVETAALNALVDEVVEAHAVDTRRIYLTGLSMGGYGTWHLALERPERYAAIAPICGGLIGAGAHPDRICALKDTPVWAFHGARDRTVPLAESADLVSALKACGGDVRFTIYPDAGHDSWTETYENPELYSWFLQHAKRTGL